MGKDPDSVYEFKRTRSWWKLKDEDSEDGEIIDFEPQATRTLALRIRWAR